MPTFRETDPFLLHQYSENALKAAASGHPDKLKEAIDDGADIEFSRVHVTPLQAAMNFNDPHWDCVNILLDAGANVNVKNKNGWSLLHQAVEGDWPEFVERLLSKAAVPWTKDMYDTTPLHVAAEKGRTQIAKILIATDVLDLDAIDIDDETPLMKAARHGHLDMLKILISKGANVHLKNRDGLTAKDIANDNVELVDYLSEQMSAHPVKKVEEETVTKETTEDAGEVVAERPKLSTIQKRRLS